MQTYCILQKHTWNGFWIFLKHFCKSFCALSASPSSSQPKANMPFKQTHIKTYLNILQRVKPHREHDGWGIVWLTHVMAGPSGSVTASYASRSLRLTSGVMHMASGYPSSTTSACLTPLPVKYNAAVPSETPVLHLRRALQAHSLFQFFKEFNYTWTLSWKLKKFVHLCTILYFILQNVHLWT